MVGVAEARTEDLAAVRELWREYWDSFGFTPCFQGFDRELENLPGEYAPPGGSLLVARRGDRIAGCVALRRMDEARGEAKRLYVRPEFRGAGAGGILMRTVIDRARACGYRELVGDTMPVMEKALAMYLRMGFERTGPYAANPAPGAIFLRLPL